jgi:hypothetical protein
MNEAIRALADAPQPSTYLHIENAQLKQQIAGMQGMINQRAAQVVNDFVNGLGVLIGAAHNGDPGAQQLLKILREQLEAASQQASPITVVRA